MSLLPTSARWRLVLRLAILLVALLTLALGLTLRLTQLPQPALELLRYVPYPVWLVPPLVLAVAGWSLGWLWRGLTLASVAWVLGVVMAPTWGSPDNGSGRLRVMSYNVKSYLAREHAGGYAALAEELMAHDADVILMQDAIDFSDPWRPIPPALKAALGERQIERRDQYVIASRVPLRDCALRPLPAPPEEAAYLRCTITVDGRDIDVATVHFLSPRKGLNNVRHDQLAGLSEWQMNFAVRLTEATGLAADIARRQRPLILGGDLNAPEDSPVVQRLLATGLRDVWSSAGRGWGWTYGHSLKPWIDFLRIDHILVSDEIGVLQVEVGGRGASQHRPVVADLVVKRQR